MRITCDLNAAAETITLTLEVPVSADPDRAADVAWAAVSRILTEHGAGEAGTDRAGRADVDASSCRTR